jgi:hypothetical protein
LGRALDEALRAGEELLRLLSGPAQAVDLDQVEAVVAQRAAAVADAAGEEAAPVDVERLSTQQKLLEQQLRMALDSLRQVNAGAQAVRHQVQGVNRLLDPGPRSRLLNTIR